MGSTLYFPGAAIRQSETARKMFALFSSGCLQGALYKAPPLATCRSRCLGELAPARHQFWEGRKELPKPQEQVTSAWRRVHEEQSGSGGRWSGEVPSAGGEDELPQLEEGIV